MPVLSSESLVTLILPRRRIGCIGDGIVGEAGHDGDQKDKVSHSYRYHKLKECNLNMYFYFIYLACLHLIVVLSSA